ncbi:MAG: hypothetical protein JSW00_13050 [Thermoplasmata archaeon]|nr:MAG: hypothetical protein JSW00_13050 [Thermoplasmata archaeon]
MIKIKHVYIAILMILVLASYYYEGYLLKASLIFNIFYIATILIAGYVMTRLELKPLVIFSVIAIILGFFVEFLNTTDTNWAYFNGGQPPVFVAIGWAFIMAMLYFACGFIKKFLDWKMNPGIPVGFCFIAFFVLSYIGEYISIITVCLYGFMLVMGAFYAYTGKFRWTFPVFIVGTFVGTVSEVLGAMCDLWSYQYGELLPFHMIFAWAANAFCLLGLLRLLGLDAEELFSE